MTNLRHLIARLIIPIVGQVASEASYLTLSMEQNLELQGTLRFAQSDRENRVTRKINRVKVSGF
jgi:hypothetical protein